MNAYAVDAVLALPEAIDVERLILGALMTDESALLRIGGSLTVDDFSLEKHRLIYRRLLDLAERRDAVDRVSLATELQRHGELLSVDGLSYLSALDDNMPRLASLENYVGIVREKAHLRRVIRISQDTINRALSGSEDSNQIINSAETALLSLGSVQNAKAPANPGTILAEYDGGLESFIDTSRHAQGVPTGFTRLDDMTGGLRESELIILAARPGQGKTALSLNVAHHLAAHRTSPRGVIVFSLEMSRESLLARLACASAQIDQSKYRAGHLNPDEKHRMYQALKDLADVPLFIDDTATTNLMDIHSKIRKLQAREDIALILLDYLQLLGSSSSRRSENRVQEVSALSRGLKLMSKDLKLPFLVLSQLSRASETRSGDHRPMLSDLRDSGCVAGDTRITLADGSWVPISELVGKEPTVITLNGYHADSRCCLRVWKTGTRPVFTVKTASGRTIKATDNHPFHTLSGFVPLADLKPGDRVSVLRAFRTTPDTSIFSDEQIVLMAHMIGDGCMAPRQPIHYTSPSTPNLSAVTEAAFALFGIRARWTRQDNVWSAYLSAGASKWHPNPLKTWLSSLGLADKRSYEKSVPLGLFSHPLEKIRLFLRHLWATDGTACISKSSAVGIAYSTTSERLALDTQELLMRCGILSRVYRIKQGKHRDGFSVAISGFENQRRFIRTVGVYGDVWPDLQQIDDTFTGRVSNTNVDTIPSEIWLAVKSAMAARMVSQRQMAALRGKAYGGSSHMTFCPSRTTLLDYASKLACQELADIANSDLFWDRIVSIEPGGVEDVFDMTVDGTHNFIGNGFVLHNSIEQDADLVIFIFREEMYRPDKESLKGIAELILAKQRNGPTGNIKLAFLHKYTQFRNLAEDYVSEDLAA